MDALRRLVHPLFEHDQAFCNFAHKASCRHAWRLEKHLDQQVALYEATNWARTEFSGVKNVSTYTEQIDREKAVERAAGNRYYHKKAPDCHSSQFYLWYAALKHHFRVLPAVELFITKQKELAPNQYRQQPNTGLWHQLSMAIGFASLTLRFVANQTVVAMHSISSYAATPLLVLQTAAVAALVFGLKNGYYAFSMGVQHVQKKRSPLLPWKADIWNAARYTQIYCHDFAQKRLIEKIKVLFKTAILPTLFAGGVAVFLQQLAKTVPIVNALATGINLGGIIGAEIGFTLGYATGTVYTKRQTIKAFFSAQLSALSQRIHSAAYFIWKHTIALPFSLIPRHTRSLRTS